MLANIRSTFIISLSCILLISSCSVFKAHKEAPAEALELYEQIISGDIPWQKYASSVENRDILFYETGEGENVTLIFGGFHGNERLGIQLVLEFTKYLYENEPDSCKVVLVPVVNPDGLLLGTRTNKNGADINRNFPTNNWGITDNSFMLQPGIAPSSEPETRAVIEILKKYNPDKIISVHTPLRVVNYDGPAAELAEIMSAITGYPASSDIGYPTPGSFGTYAGKEIGIPVITIELPIVPFERLWEPNRDALLSAIHYKTRHSEEYDRGN